MGANCTTFGYILQLYSFSDTSCIRTQYVGRFSGSDAHLFAARKEILVQPDCIILNDFLLRWVTLTKQKTS